MEQQIPPEHERPIIDFRSIIDEKFAAGDLSTIC